MSLPRRGYLVAARLRIYALTSDLAEIGARSTVCGMSSVVGIRALRNVPAMSLRVIAARLGMSVYQLMCAVDRLDGRGRCDQLAAAATSRRRREPHPRQMVLRTMACPPFVARRAGWDESRFVRRNAPGVAGWASRGVSDAAPPRVAHAKAAADPSSRPIAASQPQCPPAIAMWLISDGRPTPQYLAANTSDAAVVAALAIAGDDDARAVAADREIGPQDWLRQRRCGPGRVAPPLATRPGFGPRRSLR